MKLNELKNVIGYDFDFSDTTIDATFYCELGSIQEKYAKQIEVKKIYKDYVVCDFTNFIQHHKTAIKKYIYKNYYISWASWLYNGLFDKKYNKPCFEFNDEAYAHFIERDLDNFLREGE